MSYVKTLILSSASAITLSGMSATVMAQEKTLACEPGETYVMNVMVMGHPYWVPVFEGFKQAAEAMGCEAVFSGTPDYDITKQIASFEQDLVTNPKGILLHPMQADPFIDPINRAIDAGVDLVLISNVPALAGPMTDAVIARAQADPAFRAKVDAAARAVVTWKRRHLAP